MTEFTQTDIAKAYLSSRTSSNDCYTHPLNFAPSNDGVTAVGIDAKRIEASELVVDGLITTTSKFTGHTNSIGFPGDIPVPVSAQIRDRLNQAGKRFWAGDNISEFISDEERKALIDEATKAFENVLDALVIDRHNDPNSMDTGRRMAKMYINELMEGRYSPEPDVTAFPNTEAETRFAGMLVATAEIKSMCSHHHQTVTGKCWIGLLPSTKVIGLSKYARLAQWYGRRGTLQEELTKQIADAIMKHTETKDVAVVISAQHGCCTNRGIMAHDSTTWTSILEGQFYNPSVKSEFLSYVRGGSFQCL